MYSIAYLKDQPVKILRQLAKDLYIPNSSKITRANREHWEQLILNAGEKSKYREKLIRACTRSQHERTGSGFAAFSASIAELEKISAIINEVRQARHAINESDLDNEICWWHQAGQVDRAIEHQQQLACKVENSVQTTPDESACTANAAALFQVVAILAIGFTQSLITTGCWVVAIYQNRAQLPAIARGLREAALNQVREQYRLSAES